MKNLVLAPILIIIIFSNFAFAEKPFKWRRDELFGAFQGEKGYVFSSNSSLVERDICKPGYFKCQGTDLCCPVQCGVTCDSDICCQPGDYCCGNGIRGCCQVDQICCEDGCCPVGYICCEGGYCCEMGQHCVGDGICGEGKTKSTPKTQVPQETKIFQELLYKIKDINYRKIVINADENTPVYILENGQFLEKTLKEIRKEVKGKFVIDRKIYPVDTDHVFEVQILTNHLKSLGEIGRKLCLKLMEPYYFDKIQKIFNSESNLRLLTPIINQIKYHVLIGNNVKNPQNRDAVITYLTFDDVYEAYSKTRIEVIKLLREAAIEVFKVENVVREVHINEANPIVIYVVTSFDDYSRSIYEDLTKRKLPTYDSSNGSSSTLSLSRLPMILSMILSLMF